MNRAPQNKRMELTAPLGGRDGNVGVAAAASRSPYGERRRRSSSAVFGGHYSEHDEGAGSMGTRLIPKALPTACILLLQLLLGTASRAADSVTDVIGRLEEHLNTALGRCDAVALGRIWDDSLVFVFPSGSVATKAERLAGLKRCTPGSPNSTNEAVDVRAFGDAAVAIVVSKWSGVTDGKPFTTRFRATHVWAKRAEEWTLVAAHVSQIKE